MDDQSIQDVTRVLRTHTADREPASTSASLAPPQGNENFVLNPLYVLAHVVTFEMTCQEFEVIVISG